MNRLKGVESNWLVDQQHIRVLLFCLLTVASVVAVCEYGNVSLAACISWFQQKTVWLFERNTAGLWHLSWLGLVTTRLLWLWLTLQETSTVTSLQIRYFGHRVISLMASNALLKMSSIIIFQFLAITNTETMTRRQKNRKRTQRYNKNTSNFEGIGNNDIQYFLTFQLFSWSCIFMSTRKSN